MRLPKLPRFYTETGWRKGYDIGYHEGLVNGEDFGKRIAYNSVINKELPDILQRFSKFILNKVIGSKRPAKDVAELYEQFLQEELARMRMELQER